MIAAVVVAAIAVLVAIVAVIYAARGRGVRRLIGERVVLQTRDDRSLRGVLTGVYADCVVISHFEYLDEANPTGLPGDATVLVGNLSWIHRLGAGD